MSRYRRNRIRNELLPYLRTHFNPKADEVLARTAEVLTDEVAYLEDQAAQLLLRAQAVAAAAAAVVAASKKGKDKAATGRGRGQAAEVAARGPGYENAGGQRGREVHIGLALEAGLLGEHGVQSVVAVQRPGPRLEVHAATLASAPVALQRRAV